MVYGEITPYVVTAAESWSDARAGLGHLFKAVRVDSGLIATNANIAVGLLQTTANNGEHATLAIAGISKFVAGAAVNPAAELTVMTSGYLTTAGSGDRVVGRVGRSSVASGAVGHGLFWALANPVTFDQSSVYVPLATIEYSFTAIVSGMNVSAGHGVIASSGSPADAANKADAMLIANVVSGATARGLVVGIASPIAGGVIAAGRGLSCAASGYFVHAGSGDRVIGRALAASAAGNSGSTFTAFVNFGGTFAATSLATI